MRLTYFLTLLKNTEFIIGNSSAGVREAPFYGVHSINIGSRQQNRFNNQAIKNVKFNQKEILKAIKASLKKKRFKPDNHFGDGNSCKKFVRIVMGKNIWKTRIQKNFVDNSYFDATL